MERLTSLRVFDVAENEIDAIPERGTAAATPLRQLDVADNRLTNLTALAALFSWVRAGSKPAERRSAVNVVGNAWRCSCGDVEACRRLITVLGSSARAGRWRVPRCASGDDTSDLPSVFDFCRKLLTAVDTNQSALGCPNPDDFRQRVVPEGTSTSRTLLMIAVVAVVPTVSVSVVCVGLSRRNTRQWTRRTAGTNRRNGYHMVRETALEFTDIQ